MINSLISFVAPDVSVNTTAVYISPPIPRRVSRAPKILLRFIILFFKILYN